MFGLLPLLCRGATWQRRAQLSRCTYASVGIGCQLAAGDGIKPPLRGSKPPVLSLNEPANWAANGDRTRVSEVKIRFPTIRRWLHWHQQYESNARHRVWKPRPYHWTMLVLERVTRVELMESHHRRQGLQPCALLLSYLPELLTRL